jgi:hypothetical protein
MKGIYAALFVMLLCGCNDDPKPPTELLVNVDIESGGTLPNGWLDMEETVYTTEWTTEEASSGIRSLKISATESDDTNFALWYQHYAGVIPVDKDLVLSVRIKGNNVSGEGIAIAIRGNDGISLDAAQFSTTQGTINITGNFDWTTYQVRLNKLQKDIKSITVYLMLLNNTTGTVYFDDASLMVQ